MNFPLITNINDILPHVEGREDFKVMDKGKYFSIDYLFTLEDSFDDPMRLECRGIKFNRDGSILARPFHKFFNVGEKEHHHDIDWAREHIIMHKLDGSMVHGACIDGQPYLMTRAGHTDVAQAAEKHMSDGVHSIVILSELLPQFTPIFEYTSPDNRIVIKYERPEITLLAVRDNLTGHYWPYEQLERLAEWHGVPLAPTLMDEKVTDPVEFLSHVKQLEELEGYVIAFDNGHRLKTKAEDYLLKHRTKSYFEQEKDVLRIVLEGKTDDLMAIIDEEGQEKLKVYANHVYRKLSEFRHQIMQHCATHATLSEKEFALETQKVLPKELQSIAFRLNKAGTLQIGEIDSKIYEWLRERLLKFTRTGTTVEQVRPLLQTEWNG